VTPGVQWFCLLAVQQQVLAPETCRELLQALGDDDTDLLTFAQAILDNNLSEDLDKIQELANQAYELEQEGQTPPPLGDLEAGAAAEPVAEAPPEPAPAAPAPSAKRAPTPSAGSGFPDLSNAEAFSADQAAAAMTALLNTGRDQGASDVHVSAGSGPFMRIYGVIHVIAEQPFSDEAALKLNTALLSEEERDYFLEHKDLNVALQFENGDRYRTNLVLHKQGPAGTYHVVPNRIRSLEELGFMNHENIEKLLDHHNGLVLVTGPTGSGKTTTLAALVNSINEKRDEHIITIEDPIEIVHTCQKCFVTQREIGRHTKSYASALKGALREDPDIIVIGELHDLETIEMAITAAETGHLVIGTLHTRDSATTLNRLLDVFPPAQQTQIRAMTSESLRGIVCQQLLPRADGAGVVVANELFINTVAGAKTIREGRTHHLQGIMQTGMSQGMQSLDHSALNLFEAGLISEELALAHIRSKEIAKRVRMLSQQPEGADLDEQADQGKKKKGWFR